MHQDFGVKLLLLQTPQDVKSASFIIVPGLNGRQGMIWFESVNALNVA